jgi:hypothetical protein
MCWPDRRNGEQVLVVASLERRAVLCFNDVVSPVKRLLPAVLAISAGVAGCLREPDVIEPSEAPLPYDVIDAESAPEPWLNMPIAEGEEGCELRQVERMLNANCGACHSMPSFFPCSDCQASFSVGEPLRVSSLIDIDKVTPGDADASRLMIRIYTGEMPPPSSGLPPMPDADISWLASFIDTLEPGVTPTCAP